MTKKEMLIERVLPGMNSKISDQTRVINSLEKVTNSLEYVIMNSDNDSNNNLIILKIQFKHSANILENFLQLLIMKKKFNQHRYSTARCV